MTLDATLLQKLAEWQPAGTDRQTLNLSDTDSGWNVTVVADQCDRLSCLLWELRLQRSGGSATDLNAWSDRIVNPSTSTQEVMRLVELDMVRGEAQLRSRDPRLSGDQLLYMEILLNQAGQAVLRRYRASTTPGTRRTQVSFAITHEALANLAAHLASDR